MPRARLAHGFVFVQDLERMIAFYERAFGFATRPSSDPGFVVLSHGAPGAAGVALHRLPADIAAGIEHVEPPAWRDDTAYKLTFETDDLDGLRSAILTEGGQAKKPWTWEGRIYCECADPEGNAIQLVTPNGRDASPGRTR
ncbi:MAG: VOC family protein [Myxococcota bacterium]